MKKKNLIILLVFPFLISVFCIITVNTTYNAVDVDISHIDCHVVNTQITPII